MRAITVPEPSSHTGSAVSQCRLLEFLPRLLAFIVDAGCHVSSLLLPTIYDNVYGVLRFDGLAGRLFRRGLALGVAMSVVITVVSV